jgi:environmental stress-induced protein Ves
VNGRQIRLGDVAPRPWRNGGGLTRELLAWPSADDWSVRVSVAEVTADGPFSRFAATQRWFAVIAGEGVELTIDGAPRRVRRGDGPLCFSGEATTACRLLDGPTRDLNLMLRESRGRMLRIDDSGIWQPRAAQCGLFAAVPGRCVADGRAFAVPGETLLWFEAAPESLSFSAGQAGGAVAAWWLAATATAAETD